MEGRRGWCRASTEPTHPTASSPTHPPFWVPAKIGPSSLEEQRPLVLVGEGGITLRHTQWGGLCLSSGSVLFLFTLSTFQGMN